MRVVSQDLIADGGEPFAKDLADVGVPPRPPHDSAHAVAVNVADGELFEVGGEATAGLDLAARRDDQRLPGPFAVVFLEPWALPAAGESLGPFHRREMVPAQRDGQLRRDKQVAP